MAFYSGNNHFYKDLNLLYDITYVPRPEKSYLLRFLSTVIVILVLLSVIVYPYYHIYVLENQISLKKQELGDISRDVAILQKDKEIVDRLQHQLTIITKLGPVSRRWSYDIDRLLNLLPPGVTLKDVHFSDNTVVIEGFAPSVDDIIVLARSMETSGQYEAAAIRSITKNDTITVYETNIDKIADNGSGYDFNITANLCNN